MLCHVMRYRGLCPEVSWNKAKNVGVQGSDLNMCLFLLGWDSQRERTASRSLRQTFVAANATVQACSKFPAQQIIVQDSEAVPSNSLLLRLH